MNSVNRYFFCASEASIYDLTRRGIWHNMPLNHDLDPISSSTVVILKNDGTEASATDVKLSQYVRIISSPSAYLKSWEGNPLSVFLVEINPRLINRPDVLKIQRIRDQRIEFLKNIMVDLSEVLRIVVGSKNVENKLREVIKEDPRKISIVVEPQLFDLDIQASSHFDKELIISRSIAQPAVPAPTSEKFDLIKICKGDLLLSPMQTHVNTVNCVGIMGKGIALSFKKRYPEMFKDYEIKCKRKEVKLGQPYPYDLGNGRIILNFPTKGHWKENSRIEDVRRGLQYLVAHVKEWKIQSIALPPLGCGNGNLKWDDVFPVMREYLAPLNIPVEIYAPHDAYSFGQPLQTIPPRPPKRKSEGQGGGPLPKYFKAALKK